MGTTPRTPGAVAAVALATRRATAAVGLLLVLLVAALAALPAHPVHRTDGPDEHVQPAWRADWSRRFPGCVAMMLWPRGETPRALVVRDARGRLVRVAGPHAVPGAGSSAVGACR